MATTAHYAAIRALAFVKSRHHQLPIMGKTDVLGQAYRQPGFYNGRQHTTGVYRNSELLAIIPDCQCDYCDNFPMKRFGGPPEDGQMTLQHDQIV